MKTQDNGCCRITLSETADFLKKHDNYIILTHSSPDGDTLGCGYALYYGLKQMDKFATVLCPDLIPEKYSYFTSSTDHVNREGATVVAVDVADKKLLGSLEKDFGDCVDLNIDHHISNTEYAKYLYLDSNASAACESIYELLVLLNLKIDDVIAKALYTGIATDTGCFKYSNVTSKTHLIAADLYKYNIDAAEINRIMFDTKSRGLLELERMVLDTAEYHFDNKCMVLSVTADIQNKTGCSGPDLEGIAVISRTVEGVLAGITIKQTGDTEYKISVRTYPPLDASAIAKRIGGGGHVAAAGASVNGTLEEVKKAVLKAVKDTMEESDVRTTAP